jgi:hypothetical protein
LWGNLRERDLEDLRVYKRVLLKRIFNRNDRGKWTGCIWLRIGTYGGLL